MDICIAAQIFLAVAQAHLDTPANHNKVQEAVVYMQKECEKTKKKDSKKDE